MIEEESNELYEHHRVEADKGQEPLRVDKFLLNRLEGTSRNKIQSPIYDQLREEGACSVKLLDGKELIGLQVIIRNLSMNIHMVNKIGLKM